MDLGAWVCGSCAVRWGFACERPRKPLPSRCAARGGGGCAAGRGTLACCSGGWRLFAAPRRMVAARRGEVSLASCSGGCFLRFAPRGVLRCRVACGALRPLFLLRSRAADQEKRPEKKSRAVMACASVRLERLGGTCIRSAPRCISRGQRKKVFFCLGGKEIWGRIVGVGFVELVLCGGALLVSGPGSRFLRAAPRRMVAARRGEVSLASCSGGCFLRFAPRGVLRWCGARGALRPLFLLRSCAADQEKRPEKKSWALMACAPVRPERLGNMCIRSAPRCISRWQRERRILLAAWERFWGWIWGLGFVEAVLCGGALLVSGHGSRFLRAAPRGVVAAARRGGEHWPVAAEGGGCSPRRAGW